MFDKTVALAFMAGVVVGTGIGIGLSYLYDKCHGKNKEPVVITKYVTDPTKAENVVLTSIQPEKTMISSFVKLPTNEPSGNPADSVADLAEGIREITPDDFGFDNFYSKVSLRYYRKDGILVDEDNEEVEVLEETISVEGPDCIGNFIPGVGYFRNDNLHIDYEVIEDEGSYHEIRGVEEGTFIS